VSFQKESVLVEGYLEGLGDTLVARLGVDSCRQHHGIRIGDYDCFRALDILDRDLKLVALCLDRWFIFRLVAQKDHPGIPGFLVVAFGKTVGTDIPEQDIVEAARLYATSKPAANNTIKIFIVF